MLKDPHMQSLVGHHNYVTNARTSPLPDFHRVGEIPAMSSMAMGAKTFIFSECTRDSLRKFLLDVLMLVEKFYSVS